MVYRVNETVNEKNMSPPNSSEPIKYRQSKKFELRRFT